MPQVFPPCDSRVSDYTPCQPHALGRTIKNRSRRPRREKPHTVDYAHRDPAELLAECQKAQAAVAEVREKLRKELETALIAGHTLLG